MYRVKEGGKEKNLCKVFTREMRVTLTEPILAKWGGRGGGATPRVPGRGRGRGKKGSHCKRIFVPLRGRRERKRVLTHKGGKGKREGFLNRAGAVLCLLVSLREKEKKPRRERKELLSNPEK